MMSYQVSANIQETLDKLLALPQVQKALEFAQQDADQTLENQIELCRRYINLNYPNASEKNIFIYEDEGFSGGNTDRPQFKKMMDDASEKKFNVLICYRLDRISRNIGDFAKLIDRLGELGISFESIKEKFDTDSSLGRAMMYIASVFSQLERETIAERIRDNMHELAKTGRWLGGNTPTGYRSVQVQTITVDGKKRSSCMLKIEESEMTAVKKIFEKFLESESLTAVETYMIQNHIKTRKGKDFSRFSIKGILRNPVYMIADSDAWEYLSVLGAEIFAEKSDFDGNCGVMAYNKTLQKKGKTNKIRDIKEWIITTGRHKGVVSGKEWKQVQECLERNSVKAYRKPKNNTALLSGLLYCGDCGHYMRPKIYNSFYKDGEKKFSYLCEMKEKSRRSECSVSNPAGNELDAEVIKEISKLEEDKKELYYILNKAKKTFSDGRESNTEIEELNEGLNVNNRKIASLVENLTELEKTVADKYIIKKIEELHAENELLKKRLYELIKTSENKKSVDVNYITDTLTVWESVIKLIEVRERREVVRTIVDKIIWDGESAHIYFFG